MSRRVVVGLVLLTCGLTRAETPLRMELNVAVGDTVIWSNEDLVPHSVTALNGAFDSGGIAAGAQWQTVARAPGTSSYRCTFHPTMHGSVTVR